MFSITMKTDRGGDRFCQLHYVFHRCGFRVEYSGLNPRVNRGSGSGGPRSYPPPQNTRVLGQMHHIQNVPTVREKGQSTPFHHQLHCGHPFLPSFLPFCYSHNSSCRLTEWTSKISPTHPKPSLHAPQCITLLWTPPFLPSCHPTIPAILSLNRRSRSPPP